MLVDAAAEILTVPNVHLQNGATLVGYSGGKCLRGPQAAGLLLGRKDLVKAAWVHSAPHHGFARGYKVGKEEAIGMLMAVEMWMKRDHDAEWARWTVVDRPVGKRVSAIAGVTTTSSSPRGSPTACPPCACSGTARSSASAGDAAARTLFEGNPRVGVFAGPPRDGSRPHRRRRESVHDGGGRREDRGRSALRAAVEPAAQGRGAAAAAAPPTSAASGT